MHGLSQREGLYYDEVHAPVARLEAIRIFIADASCRNFKLYQMDVKTDLLSGKVKEEIYIKKQLGFEDPDRPNYVNQLEKALYSLNQAPCAWYATLG